MRRAIIQIPTKAIDGPSMPIGKSCDGHRWPIESQYGYELSPLGIFSERCNIWESFITTKSPLLVFDFFFKSAFILVGIFEGFGGKNIWLVGKVCICFLLYTFLGKKIRKLAKLDFLTFSFIGKTVFESEGCLFVSIWHSTIDESFAVVFYMHS